MPEELPPNIDIGALLRSFRPPGYPDEGYDLSNTGLQAIASWKRKHCRFDARRLTHVCRAPPFWCSRALHHDCIAYSLLVGLLIYRHFSWSRLIPMLVETAALSGATAWCETGDYGAVHHALAAAERGDVIIVEAGGRLDAAMIGEILCGFARRKGIAGVAVTSRFYPRRQPTGQPAAELLARAPGPPNPEDGARRSVLVVVRRTSGGRHDE